MLGSLIPCDGGPPIGLSKPKLTLKLRSSSEPESEKREGRAELLFADGVWSVTTEGDGPRVLINDTPCDHSSRLMPNDVLTVGRHRYRITYHYHAPHASPPPPTQARPAAAERPVVAPRPVETEVLGILIPCAGGRPIMLRKERIIIGRAKDCDVVLPVASVSSRHCELDLIRGYWQAVDLDSRNGTFVDGMRYQAKWLFPGNVIGLSSQRFRLEYSPKGDRPAVAQDDVPVMSKKSLMACVGLSEDKLDDLVQGHEEEDTSRRRWVIE